MEMYSESYLHFISKGTEAETLLVGTKFSIPLSVATKLPVSFKASHGQGML